MLNFTILQACCSISQDHLVDLVLQWYHGTGTQPKFYIYTIQVIKMSRISFVLSGDSQLAGYLISSSLSSI